MKPAQKAICTNGGGKSTLCLVIFTNKLLGAKFS